MPKLNTEELIAALEHHFDSIKDLTGEDALKDPMEVLEKIRRHVDEAEKLLEEAGDE